MIKHTYSLTISNLKKKFFPFFSQDDEEEEDKETSLGPLPVPPRPFPKPNRNKKNKNGSGTSSLKRNKLVVEFSKLLCCMFS
jgi:hypothetical protein